MPWPVGWRHRPLRPDQDHAGLPRSGCRLAVPQHGPAEGLVGDAQPLGLREGRKAVPPPAGHRVASSLPCRKPSAHGPAGGQSAAAGTSLRHGLRAGRATHCSSRVVDSGGRRMADPDDRDAGFYWISIDGQEVEVAQWQSEWSRWLVTGSTQPLSDAGIGACGGAERGAAAAGGRRHGARQSRLASQPRGWRDARRMGIMPAKPGDPDARPHSRRGPCRAVSYCSPPARSGRRVRPKGLLPKGLAKGQHRANPRPPARPWRR